MSKKSDMTSEGKQHIKHSDIDRKSSKLSVRSRFSNRSNSSITSFKAIIAAEAAALKTKLQFADIQAQKEAELKLKQTELEKIQTMRDLQEAEAKLEAINKVQREDCSEFDNEEKHTDDKHALVEGYLRSLPILSHYGEDNVYTENPVPVRDIPAVPQATPSPTRTPMAEEKLTTNETANNKTQVLDLAKVLADNLNLSRLPPPQPSLFSGDPLKYPSWKSSFETLIERRGIPPSEKLHYLKKYLTGPAKDVVEGFFFLTDDDAFIKAKELLQHRYGDPFVVASAFRDKLDSWPKIASRDGIGLRQFADFLRQCETAMETIGSLQILNDDRENKKLLTKIPEWLITRWGRKVANWKEDYKIFPPFTEFVKFIVKEANIACDPVTSLQSLKSTDRSNKGDQKRSAGVSSFYTGTTQPMSDRGPQRQPCLLCDRVNHHLDECRIFLAKTLKERKEFASSKGLCFGCMNKGHRSKECRQRSTCKTCGKRHPTSLHGDVRPNEPDSKMKCNSPQDAVLVKSMSSHTRISHLNGTFEGNKSSMIVPVWLSHRERPNRERLVYALLDTQSDTTFILEDTCDALGLQGPKVQLLLSTMHSENQQVDSRKIEGLRVRGYDSSLEIPLPAAFTREIMPANRTHIPTAEMARSWPHLDRMADQLMPLAGCEVGLLIGYNCSRALAPRDVIPPDDNGPYAQKTDLGWGIVGIVNPNGSEINDFDVIGTSHRILTCEVPSLSSDGQCQDGKTVTQDHVLFSFRTRIKELINPFSVAEMMDLDFSERTVDDTAYSQDDHKFLKRIQDGLHQQSDGHLVMPLPFREKEPPSLVNNKIQALRRLNQLRARFRRDQKYYLDYSAFMCDVVKKGYAEKVPKSELDDVKGQVWYIPHHGVYHAKKPGKIRVVFDCSARYGGESLNDHLLQGPDLTNTLVGVLCRFRKEAVAFICDVEQMFYQFKVIKEHYNFLRFLWWDDGNYDAEPTVYYMKVHLFGAASSPGCANFGLKRIANIYEAECGSAAADFMRRNFYVDDGLTSVPTTSEAIDLITRTRELCARGGLRLHKFVSNSRAVIDSVAPEDRTKGIKDLDLRLDLLPIERALGVQWCVESDTFQFRITLDDKPLTRRGVLSTICSVYDPLGFVGPVLLVGKQILQSLCRDQADWDDPLNDETRSRWERWRRELPLLEKQKIQRCMYPKGFGKVISTEIHHFSDASASGYAQCSYLRLTDDEQKVHCSFIMGKTRVTPLKTVTIPRLELTAAVVSVKVSAFLQRELEYRDIVEVFWTDSQVVLGYISNESRRFHVFVANRIQQIRDRSEPKQWRHVCSEDNPADEGSRGLSVAKLSSTSKWLKGPDFLWKKNLPTQVDPFEYPLCPEDPEVKKVQVFASSSTTQHSIQLERFSSWYLAKRAIAACLKFKSRLRERCVQKSQEVKQMKGSRGCLTSNYAPATVEELHQSELEIIKLVQRESFPDEIKILTSLKVNKGDIDRELATERNKSMKKTSSLFRLDPFVDEDGIVRVGGRIRKAKLSFGFKHPVILPRNHHVTKLIIRHYHLQIAHQGRGMTTNAIRANGFWIIGCSSAVRNFIAKCVKCRRLYSGPLSQKMANLPEDRLQPAPPFTYCGVDYFGPWIIKEGRKELKRYGALFTCLSSRAIHIEVANSLSSDSFINAFRRFTAMRGPVKLLRSDQGTNFVGAELELKKALKEMDHTKVKLFLTEVGCEYPEFRMNTPSASHAGGVWERQIRSVRRVLQALMDHSGTQLDEESLRTFMYEAMAVVNSRPLTVNTLNDPTSLEPLTPNHLLTMKSSVVLPLPGIFQRVDLYSQRRWRRVQHLVNEFWSRWKEEYLHTLQPRQKWTRERSELQVGDIVMVLDKNLPRNEWQVGRVVEVYPDDDKHVRSVKLAMSDASLDTRGRRTSPMKYLERPVQKLVLLLGNQERQETREIPVREP